MGKKERLELSQYRMKVDIIDCPVCHSVFIKLSDVQDNCSVCGSFYNIHLLGEIITFDKKDFTELKKYGKIKLTNNLKIRYGLNF